jgi:DNA-binding beta-propeller fold protein YncE
MKSSMHLRYLGIFLVITVLLLAATAGEFRVPGLNYPAQIHEQLSILPGGRVLHPYGRQLLTGTAPFAIAVSPNGKTIVTANIGVSTAIGVNRPSITVISPGKRDEAWNLSDHAAEPRDGRGQSWQGLTAGLVVTGTNTAWVSEGDTGRVVELNLSTGSRKASVTLNGENYRGSFTEALAYDFDRNLLLAADQTNSRVVLIDPKRTQAPATIKLGARPVALALSGDGKRIFVTCVDPPSLSIVDLSDAAAPKVTSEAALSVDAPVGIAVRGDEVYISSSLGDSIVVVNGQSAKVEGEIALRIPGLEKLRGITPLGLAFEPKSKRLLVAEAGINAVGVIDADARRVLGHLPVGWFPTAVAVHNDQIYVASERGFGTGPSSPARRVRMFGGGRPLAFETDTSVLRRGSVSVFAVPDDNELAKQTAIVLQANGFLPRGDGAAAKDTVVGKPAQSVSHVVLIVKGNRAFDEILGDVERAGDKAVLSEPSFARFGMNGYVSGGKRFFSLHAEVTPNHHQLIERWSFADNYYADSDFSMGAYRWLTGGIPDKDSVSCLLYREAANRVGVLREGALWKHLDEHHVDFRRFDAEPDIRVSDQQRADQFIDAIRKDYVEPDKPLPRFLFIRLANDAGGPPRPAEGYTYEASYVADNDYALGRIVEFLSGTPWWRHMAVFCTEAGAEGGADHVDSHRTLLLGVGPWFRHNYVSHTNTSAPGLLRTVFRLLDIPPMNLYDATAGDLLDMFGPVPDEAPFHALTGDSRLYDPAPAK